MKKLYSVLLALMASTFLIGCSQGEEVHREATSPMSYEDSSTELNPQRGQAEARTEALRYLRRLRPEARGLSAGHNLAVYPFLTPRTQRLRSLRDSVRYHLVDTMLYLVNVGKEEGTLLIAGDKRIPTVLGFIPRGHVNPDSINSHPGLSMVFANLPAYYERSVRSYDTYPHDPEDDSYWTTPISTKRTLTPWSEGLESTYGPEQVGPLCPVLWHQSNPYNDKAPLIGHKRALAGCVAVATAQLCATYRFPKSIGKHQLDWDLLTRYPTYKQYTTADSVRYADEVSTLLRGIGDLLENEWGIAGTSAFTGSVPPVLLKLGYRIFLRRYPFNTSSVINSLDRGLPVLVSGTDTSNGGRGHTWLCDGYRYLAYDVVSTYPNRCSENKMELCVAYRKERHQELVRYLHFNWGWGTTSSGEDAYVIAGCFVPNKISENRNYRHDVSMLISSQP